MPEGPSSLPPTLRNATTLLGRFESLGLKTAQQGARKYMRELY
jgi:hypothetical protein